LNIHLGYIWEKLHGSVSALAEGEGELKHRLANAYVSQLIKLKDHPSSPLELPENLAEELRAVLRRLQDTYQSGQSMRDLIGSFTFESEEARDIIGKILSLYYVVCRMMGPP
jgi:hypothetical protein